MPHLTLRIIREERASLSAILRSISALLELGPSDDRARFFDVLRAMLFYIDEFPERRHRVNKSNFFFPAVARRAPELKPVIARLEADHSEAVAKVRELQHLLLSWELLGEGEAAFGRAIQEYGHFYLNHMRIEESEIFPVADARLTEDDWPELDSKFMHDRDPLSGGELDTRYERLFSRIVLVAPEPIGLRD